MGVEQRERERRRAKVSVNNGQVNAWSRKVIEKGDMPASLTSDWSGRASMAGLFDHRVATMSRVSKRTVSLFCFI